MEDQKGKLTSSCMNYMRTNSGVGPSPGVTGGEAKGATEGRPRGPKGGPATVSPKGTHGTKVPGSSAGTLAATPP